MSVAKRKRRKRNGTAEQDMRHFRNASVIKKNNSSSGGDIRRVVVDNNPQMKPGNVGLSYIKASEEKRKRNRRDSRKAAFSRNEEVIAAFMGKAEAISRLRALRVLGAAILREKQRANEPEERYCFIQVPRNPKNGTTKRRPREGTKVRYPHNIELVSYNREFTGWWEDNSGKICRIICRRCKWSIQYRNSNGKLRAQGVVDPEEAMKLLSSLGFFEQNPIVIEKSIPTVHTTQKDKLGIPDRREPFLLQSQLAGLHASLTPSKRPRKRKKK